MSIPEKYNMTFSGVPNYLPVLVKLYKE